MDYRNILKLPMTFVVLIAIAGLAIGPGVGNHEVNIIKDEEPVVGEPTTDILSVEYTGFVEGDSWTIKIYDPDGAIIWAESGDLTGTDPEYIPITWTPSQTGDHTIRAYGYWLVNEEQQNQENILIIGVMDQEIVNPTPELSTIALMSAGLIGLFGLVRRQRRN